MDAPVVHVSWSDARATARGPANDCPPKPNGSSPRAVDAGAPFPWGDELEPASGHRMNVWQGRFPSENTLEDGYYGTCPVDAFAPNGYGLYNVTGNVLGMDSPTGFTLRSERLTAGPTRPDRRAGRTGFRRAAPDSAMRPTAGATASPAARATSRTPRRATSGSGCAADAIPSAGRT